MELLLTPFIQNELGIVILKPSKEMMPFFSRKLLIRNAPTDLQNKKPGFYAKEEKEQLEVLESFFLSEKVWGYVGSNNSFYRYLQSIKICQNANQEGYHDKNITITNNQLSLCWHCDNEYRNNLTGELLEIAKNNRIEYIKTWIKSFLFIPQSGTLSIGDVCWWAVLNGLYEELPKTLINQLLRNEKKWQSVTKESDYQPDDKPTAEKAIKTIKKIGVDEDPPMAYMKRPKMQRWENTKYLQWVKKQPCMCCGQQADDPHHIIGVGFGAMGSKTHDLFTIPLCRTHHDELHRNTKAWEQQYGQQTELLIKFLDKSLGIGALS